MTLTQKLIRPARRRSILFALFALCTAALLSITGVTHQVYAAEQAQGGADTSRGSSTRDNPQDKADNQDTTASSSKDKTKGEDIFRPSEEISEDFAVSFPVDI